MIELGLLVFAIAFFSVVSVETLPKLPGGFCVTNYLCFVTGCLLGVCGAAWWMGISVSSPPIASDGVTVYVGLMIASLVGGLGLVGVKHWLLVKTIR